MGSDALLGSGDEGIGGYSTHKSNIMNAIWQRLRFLAGLFQLLLNLAKQNKRLFVLASLPLLDGFFVGALISDVFETPISSLAFGITALSGGGCIGEIIRIQDSLSRKTIGVCIAYVAVGVFAFGLATLKPFFTQSAPVSMEILTSLFLILFGLKLGGFDKKVLSWFPAPSSVLRVMLIVVSINFLRAPGVPEMNFNRDLFGGVGLALLGGFGFSMSGVLLSVPVQILGHFKEKYLKIGQAGSLAFMGLKILMPQLPIYLVISPVLIGYTYSIFKSWKMYAGETWKNTAKIKLKFGYAYSFLFDWKASKKVEHKEPFDSSLICPPQVIATLSDSLGLTCSFSVAEGVCQPKRIVRVEAFERGAELVKEGAVNAVLVPGAYPGINAMLMDGELEVLDVFLAKIPDLVLVGRKDVICNVVPSVYYHPATSPLFSRIGCEIQSMIPVSSNPEACIKLQKGHQDDLAITNRLCAEYYKLKIHMVLREAINMPWALFGKK